MSATLRETPFYQEILKEGREEGREEGRQEARNAVIQMIHLCEQLLNRPEAPTEQLASLPLEDLTRLAEELQSQLRQGAGRAIAQ